MLAFGPFTLSLPVMAVAAAPMTIGYVIALRGWVPDDLARWIAAAWPPWSSARCCCGSG